MHLGQEIEGKYRLDALLGSGGMGVVFAATHLKLGSRAAIKILRREVLFQGDIPQRFMREARTASRLRSEHIARVTDVGALPTGEPYMVMEMLEGYDLGSRLKLGPVDPARAAAYISHACAGLSEAHALGLVHRDIKPANLFVTSRPSGAPLVKLLDFGVATAAPGDVDHGMTSTQVVIGSPSYLSPEQVRTLRDVDGRADIWALGVSLYELIAGRPPFIAPSVTALCLEIVTEPHPPVPGLMPAMMRILDRCLAKDRHDRFATVEELAAALAPHCEEPLTAEAVSVTPVASSSVVLPAQVPTLTTSGLAVGQFEATSIAGPRRRALWIGLAATATLALGAVAITLVSRRADDDPKPRAAAPALAPTTPDATIAPAPDAPDLTEDITMEPEATPAEAVPADKPVVRKRKTRKPVKPAGGECAPNDPRCGL